VRTMTLEIPIGTGSNVQTGTVIVTGEAIGPFLIHQTPYFGRRNWTVTHIPSRFSAMQNLPSRKRAQWIARQLLPLTEWEFSDPAHAQKLPADVLQTIKVLRIDARYGDCQGTAR
jgi:hypothetical protein